VGFNSEWCGCVLKNTHILTCACSLARYDLGIIPLDEVHVMWTRLIFYGISSCVTSTELTIKQEVHVILNRFEQVDIGGRVTVKGKLREIAYPYMTFMCAPLEKVKTKKEPKKLVDLRGQQNSYHHTLSMLTTFIL